MSRHSVCVSSALTQIKIYFYFHFPYAFIIIFLFISNKYRHSYQMHDNNTWKGRRKKIIIHFPASSSCHYIPASHLLLLYFCFHRQIISVSCVWLWNVVDFIRKWKKENIMHAILTFLVCSEKFRSSCQLNKISVFGNDCRNLYVLLSRFVVKRINLLPVRDYVCTRNIKWKKFIFV